MEKNNMDLEVVSEEFIDELSHTQFNEQDEKDVMDILAKQTKMDVLWRIYKEFMDAYVISNNTLKKIMFHMIIGSYFTKQEWTYNESGDKKSMRLHTFVIQPSGTGKSQTFKTIEKLLEELDIDYSLTLKDNESSLTGSVYENKKTGETIKCEGMLAKLLVWVCDEGSILLKKTTFNENLTDYLQMVMDEPGKVSKGMKLGKIEYKSNTTIVAGSYMFDEFQQTIMQKGFLQRMFVLMVEFTDEDERSIRIGKNLLKLIRKKDRIAELQARFKKHLHAIKIPENSVIEFNVKATQKFSLYMETIYDEYITMQFTGEKQMVLKTFFNRVHTIIDKIAAQRAIINGHKEVMYDDMIYASELAKIHLSSVQRIFEKINSKTIATPFDKKCGQVLAILKAEQGNITKDVLLLKLKELYNVGRWDFGWKRTNSFLAEMEKKKIININPVKGGSDLIIMG